jgi:1-deoxy-D-xylulose-5-phosphate synthase
MTLRLLEQLNLPEDLKGLSNEDLYKLAEEIREVIIETVSKTGGHLAASLGVVELAVALHMELDSPKDKILWDVSHQSYAHKLLTGRLKQFSTLRQWNGLSGFMRRDESEHDVFGAGHSSTSISAALGFALARDLAGDDYQVVSVIGDGSMGGGLAFEALNNAGQMKRNLIVVLNDNEMSISTNVGALANYLGRLRNDPTLRKIKSEVKFALERIPAIGSHIVKTANKFKEALKYMVVPGMLFEELGFTYIGPINGHNIIAIRKGIQDAKMRKGPVLLHVVTKKGKGYVFAENNPERFHSIGPFNVETGKPVRVSKKQTFTNVFSRTLVECAAKNEKIVAISAAMPDGTGLDYFQQMYPDRFFDVGIAEQHAVTMAAGLAASGYHPVVAIYSSFLQRAYDQILHDVCLQNLPVVFAVDRAGLVGEDGPTHHGIFDFAYTTHIPNIIVMAPKDKYELQIMLKWAFSVSGPVFIRYPKAQVNSIAFQNRSRIEMGSAEVLSFGKDVAILAIGSMVEPAMQAADILVRSGIDATVVNMRFVKPLDKELIIDVANNIGRIITVEEHALAGGFGSSVLGVLETAGISNVIVRRLGVPDRFIQHGSRDLLLDVCKLGVQHIVEASLEIAGRRFQVKSGSGF